MTRNWQFWVRIALATLAGVVASAGALAVVVASFTLSFDGLRAVAITAGIRKDWAYLMPVSIDGAMATATVVAIVMYYATRRHAIYPWVVLMTGVAVSIAGNGLHSMASDEPMATEVRFAVATVPAVMLALSFHLLAKLVSMAWEQVANTDGQLPANGDGMATGFGTPAGHIVANGDDHERAMEHWANAARNVMAKLEQRPPNVSGQFGGRDNGGHDNRAQWPDAGLDIVANPPSPDRDGHADGQDRDNGQSDDTQRWQGLATPGDLFADDMASGLGDVVEAYVHEMASQTRPQATDKPKPVPRRYRKLTPKEKAKAVEMANSLIKAGATVGDACDQVALDFGVSARTIRRAVDAAAGRPVSGPPADENDE